MEKYLLKMSIHLYLIALQTSLDFEKGASIADNLFQLYEYVKYQVIANSKSEKDADIAQAVSIISEIHDSWNAIKCLPTVLKNKTLLWQV